MTLILYKKDASPPCRSVLMVAKALALEMEMEEVDTMAGAHKEEEFLEKNPQHTIPVLDDDGFILVDSGAIIMYLVTKNAGDDNADLFPEDPQLRSLIHHRLFYNCGTLQTLIGQIIRYFLEGNTSLDDKLIDKTIEAYKTLEKILGDREWMVGDTLTIADLALYPSVTTLIVAVPVDEETCPKLMEWITRVSELPCADANEAGLEEFKGLHERAISGSLVGGSE